MWDVDPHCVSVETSRCNTFGIIIIVQLAQTERSRSRTRRYDEQKQDRDGSVEASEESLLEMVQCLPASTPGGLPLLPYNRHMYYRDDGTM